MDGKPNRPNGWDYEEWTELLGSHFFGISAKPGRPTTYFVDDDVLAEISGLTPEAATTSLVSAIEASLGELDHPSAYRTALQRTLRWDAARCVGFPPCLPLLALAVLAGSRMASDNNVSKTNYYKRYRELTRLEGRGVPPGYAEVVPDLWDAYRDWLDNHLGGSLGTSTATKHRHFVYIGYALSQALLRASDRNELTAFLDSLGEKPDLAGSTEHVLALLRAWASTKTRLSAGARHMIADDGFAPQVVAILSDVAAHWDGVVLDETGRHEARVRLLFRPEDQEFLSSVADRPDGFPETLTISVAGSPVTLTATEGASHYREAPTKVDDQVLDRGVTSTSGRYSFHLAPARTYLLADDTRLGAWTSARRFVWGVPHVLLVRNRDGAAVESLLLAGAQQGWRRINGRAVLPEGWIYFRDVMLTSRAADAWLGSLLEPLLPVAASQVALRDGLHLGRRSVYLIGGEPDLVTDGDFFRLDGILVDTANRARIPLRDRALALGRHRVEAPTRRLSFALSRGQSQGALDPSAGMLLGDGFRVQGAAAPPVDKQAAWALQLKKRRQHIVLGAVPGQVVRPTRPDPPSWLDGRLVAPHYEYSVPFEPVWLVVKMAGRTLAIEQQAETAPYNGPASSEADLIDWVRTVLAEAPGGDQEQLWGAYRTIARRLEDLGIG